MGRSSVRKVAPLLLLFLLFFLASIKVQSSDQIKQEEVNYNSVIFHYTLTMRVDFRETTQIRITIEFQQVTNYDTFGQTSVSSVTLNFDNKQFSYNPSTSPRTFTFDFDSSKIILENLRLKIEISNSFSSPLTDSYSSSSTGQRNYHFFVMSNSAFNVFQFFRILVILGIFSIFRFVTGDPLYNFVSQSNPSAKQMNELYQSTIPTDTELIAEYSQLSPNDSINRLMFSIIPLFSAYGILTLTSIDNNILSILGFIKWVFFFPFLVLIVILINLIIKHSMWSLNRYSQKIGFFMQNSVLLVITVNPKGVTIDSYSPEKYTTIDTQITKEMEGMGQNQRLRHEITLQLISEHHTANILTIEYSKRHRIREIINKLSNYGFVELETVKVPKNRVKNNQNSIKVDNDKPHLYCKYCKLVESNPESKYCSDCGTPLSPL